MPAGQNNRQSLYRLLQQIAFINDIDIESYWNRKLK